MATRGLPSDVQIAKQLWKDKATPEELMKVLNCPSRHRALAVIVKYRGLYGEKHFPYRKKAVADGGYSKELVAELSRAWKAGCTHTEFAAIAKIQPRSTWGTVQHLRNKHGEKKFPIRDAS